MRDERSVPKNGYPLGAFSESAHGSRPTHVGRESSVWPLRPFRARFTNRQDSRDGSGGASKVLLSDRWGHASNSSGAHLRKHKGRSSLTQGYSRAYRPRRTSEADPLGPSLARALVSAQGREVGVRAAMLVAPPEQVSHNRSLASSAIDRALPLDACCGHDDGVAASCSASDYRRIESGPRIVVPRRPERAGSRATAGRSDLTDHGLGRWARK